MAEMAAFWIASHEPQAKWSTRQFAANPILDALASATGEQLRGSALPPAPSANGPSACPLCCGASAAQRTNHQPARLSVRTETDGVNRRVEKAGENRP
jgi:hypothetical protein